MRRLLLVSLSILRTFFMLLNVFPHLHGGKIHETKLEKPSIYNIYLHLNSLLRDLLYLNNERRVYN